MSRRHNIHIQDIRRSAADKSEGAAVKVGRRDRRASWIARARVSPLGKNSLKSGVGFFVPAVGLLVFTPILVHLLGTGDYGLWALSSSMLGLVGVLDLGLSIGIGKHVAQYRAVGDTAGVSSSVTMGAAFYVAVGLLATPVAFAFASLVAPAFASQGISDGTVTDVLRIVSLGILPLLLKNAGLAVPIGMQQFGPPMTIAILQTAVTLGLATVVAYRGGSIQLVVASTVVSLWLVSAASVVVGYRMLSAIGGRVIFSRRELRTLLRFSSFTSITALGHVLFASLDRVVVGAVLGASAVAYYSVSIGVALTLLTFADVLTRPLMPAASAWVSVGNWSLVRSWLVRATLALVVIEALAAGVLLAISAPFMTLWLGSDFAHHALPAFRILVVVFAVVAVGAPAFHIANGVGYPWAPAVGGFTGGALTIASILLLAPKWGVTGAAAANVWAWLALFPLVYLMWKIRRRISPPVREAPT
jgi:O-antigen/teichoic acid export membrane protein